MRKRKRTDLIQKNYEDSSQCFTQTNPLLVFCTVLPLLSQPYKTETVDIESVKKVVTATDTILLLCPTPPSSEKDQLALLNISFEVYYFYDFVVVALGV